MNKRQEKKNELKNEIINLKRDYKLQEKKIDVLNNINNKFLNEKEKLIYEFKKQEQLLKDNKESLANVIQAQSYLEIENSKRATALNENIKNQNERIHKLEYSVFGMIILMIIVFVLEVIKWLV
ncbi:hypothetical protein [uncultured Gemella sp.]|uniref:hypothetical protein n=1 Tax=uncultured Gemella sp. TaxID=254352 RepID=UPI0028D0F3B5|nr:hypothetical protein [uncultured Gemella sp.]